MISPIVKVSICVAQYNRSTRIPESIRSLLNQDMTDFEVIVVNDGSPDPNVKLELEKFDDPRLTVIHQTNTGFVGAMRCAIENAKGEYIAIHGAGDVSLPKRISTQAAYLDAHADIGAVGAFYQNCNFDNGTTQILETRQGSEKTRLTIEDFAKNPIPFGHGEVMYRKSLYERVGGYRHFFRFAQDHDLWLRMAEHCDMALVPEVLYQRGYFAADGIATNIDKLIVQKLLSNFAMQIHEEKKLGKPDLVEKYGTQAGLFRQRTKAMAIYTSNKALCFLYQNDQKTAYKLSKFSVEEHSYWKNNLVLMVAKLALNERLHKVIVGLMKCHPRSEKWLK
ncbi:glycosyltransferase family 2 protein [Paraglaciecola aquimarina]|uniref:Glycosyltransferase family 2 protein n=1 Tax=Paraglaciecola aquimarina TaxID=1235557 RepID=A0ABU3T1D4_9ALTE|nr:glycosyltransferase family 2 protein [Paraglaciecola aquimarina]MDU0355992.1 glycosyltransferase family 2 protein [Paraglaciecola aquimarina]